MVLNDKKKLSLTKHTLAKLAMADLKMVLGGAEADHGFSIDVNNCTSDRIQAKP